MRQWTKEEIKGLRKAKGFSQKAFSREIGVTEHYVYYLERGMREPSQTLRLLLDCIEEKHIRTEKRKKKGV
jgi:DNA-binding transcriptional regulator YiaG